MEFFHIGVTERFLSSGYGIVAFLDGLADMFLEIRRPLMAGIIRILLEIALEMLIALDVFSLRYSDRAWLWCRRSEGLIHCLHQGFPYLYGHGLCSRQ